MGRKRAVSGAIILIAPSQARVSASRARTIGASARFDARWRARKRTSSSARLPNSARPPARPPPARQPTHSPEPASACAQLGAQRRDYAPARPRSCLPATISMTVCPLTRQSRCPQHVCRASACSNSARASSCPHTGVPASMSVNQPVRDCPSSCTPVRPRVRVPASLSCHRIGLT